MEEQAKYEVMEVQRHDLDVARDPQVVLEEAKRAAKALGDVITNKKKPVIFNGEQYLEFEDWQTVGRFYGITAKVIRTDPVEFGEVRGFEAHAVAMSTRTGLEISAADAMCLNDEPNWAKKPLFQLRSMAQTRACAKALRNVLAWVVVLAGYKPTPAEEMDGVFKDNTRPPVQQPTRASDRPQAASSPATTEGTIEDKLRAAIKEHGELSGLNEAAIISTFTKFQGKDNKEKSADDLAHLLKSEKWAGATLSKIRADIQAIKDARGNPEGIPG